MRRIVVFQGYRGIALPDNDAVREAVMEGYIVNVLDTWSSKIRCERSQDTVHFVTAWDSDIPAAEPSKTEKISELEKEIEEAQKLLKVLRGE